MDSIWRNASLCPLELNWKAWPNRSRCSCMLVVEGRQGDSQWIDLWALVRRELETLLAFFLQVCCLFVGYLAWYIEGEIEVYSQDVDWKGKTEGEV